VLVVQAARAAAVNDTTAFVVAGGKSRRMGTDKALLAWGGTTLLDHAIQRLKEVTHDVRLLSGVRERYLDRGLPVIRDALPHGGSLVGVYSGLAALAAGNALFLAVDLPNVPPALLRHLVERAEGFDAVVPVSTAGPEPLCAVYAAACSGPIRRAIERGELKMTSFWPEVKVLRLDAAELARFGGGELFLNLNEPTDYAAARR
jgi:molybdopterin-guanine dinucleotide biosynthesis protein A